MEKFTTTPSTSIVDPSADLLQHIHSPIVSHNVGADYQDGLSDIPITIFIDGGAKEELVQQDFLTALPQCSVNLLPCSMSGIMVIFDGKLDITVWARFSIQVSFAALQLELCVV